MKRTDIKSLREALRGLKDYRRGQGRMHSIDTVMMIVVMGVMSGCRGYEGLMDFIERERSVLMRHLKPRNDRLPSKSTLWRVMTHIDEQAFLKIFSRWVASFHTVLQEELVAIDGKAIKGGKTDDEDRKIAHLVSLFSVNHKEILMMKKTTDKSNEILLVQKMINATVVQTLGLKVDTIHLPHRSCTDKLLDSHCDRNDRLRQQRLQKFPSSHSKKCL